jgi:Family of unknown function (DUF6459)
MTTTLATPTVRMLRYEPAPGSHAALPARRRVVVPPEPYVLPALDEPLVRGAVGSTLRLAIEVLDGRRTPDQLETRLDPSPLGYWRAEAARKRSGAASRVLRLRVFLPHPDAAEVAAVCRIDGRVRALAARFERRGPAWCCTVLRLV